MTPEAYKTERERRGTQLSVAALLRVDPQTISRRERGEIPITREAGLALLSLPKKRKARRPSNPQISHAEGKYSMKPTDLNRRICPGCGTLDPKSAVTSCFSCVKCEWESDNGLPTLRKIMRGGVEDCNNVNLSAFLKTLFSSPNSEVTSLATEERSDYAG